MKLKIVKEEKEISGVIVEKAVTLFGNSAHIPFAKQHTGKIVNVVVPDDPKYVWVLPTEDKKKIIKVCTDILKKKKETKMSSFYKSAVKSLSEKYLEIEDLQKILILLDDAGEKKLSWKLKNTYNL